LKKSIRFSFSVLITSETISDSAVQDQRAILQNVRQTLSHSLATTSKETVASVFQLRNINSLEGEKRKSHSIRWCWKIKIKNQFFLHFPPHKIHHSSLAKGKGVGEKIYIYKIKLYEQLSKFCSEATNSVWCIFRDWKSNLLMSREHLRNSHKFRLIENPCADNYVRQSALNSHPLEWKFRGKYVCVVRLWGNPVACELRRLVWLTGRWGWVSSGLKPANLFTAHFKMDLQHFLPSGHIREKFNQHFAKRQFN